MQLSAPSEWSIFLARVDMEKVLLGQQLAVQFTKPVQLQLFCFWCQLKPP